MSSTYLVTGGAGFIGANLVHYLLERTDARIVVVDALTYAANPLTVESWERDARVTFVRADTADRPAMRQVVDAHRPDAVLNLAAETHVDRSIDGPDAFVHTNVNGTFALLEAARRYWATLDGRARRAFRFLQVSTDEVYGSLGAEGLFAESTRYAPNSPYSASKAAADHLVRAYHHTYEVPTLITHCSNNYGPFQHPEKLIPLTILNALEGRSLPIYGNGQNVRDWLHVTDHCDGIVTVLECGRPGEHYNIGASNEQPSMAIVDLICDTLEEFRPARGNRALARNGFASYRDLKQFVADRPGHDRRYAVDATKIRKELEWQPVWTLHDGIRATARWYVETPEWHESLRAGYDRGQLGLSAVGERR